MIPDTTVTKYSNFSFVALGFFKKNICSSISISLCVLFLFSVFIHAQPSVVNVRGKILSSNNSLIRGVITIVEGEKLIDVKSYQTNDFGLYAFQVSWKTKMQIVARADGFMSDEKIINILPGQTEIVHDFTLSPVVSISGTIIDEHGDSVPNAEISVRYPGKSRRFSFSQEVGPFRADDFGRFVIHTIEQGRPFTLDVQSDSHPLSSSAPMSSHEAQRSDLIVPITRVGYVVNGKVLRPSGEPLVGVSVRIAATGDLEGYSSEERSSIAFLRRSVRLTKTDSAGQFTFSGIPSGSVRVFVETSKQRIVKELSVKFSDTEMSVLVD